MTGNIHTQAPMTGDHRLLMLHTNASDTLPVLGNNSVHNFHMSTTIGAPFVTPTIWSNYGHLKPLIIHQRPLDIEFLPT